MKRSAAILLACFLFFVLPLPVHAAITLHEMEIDVYLNENGDGDVTVLWDSTQDSTGTENYIPIENLGDSTIENFRVSEEGMNYTENPNWDIDLSRDEKTGTYGVIDTSDGVELAWGIGEPGRHQYQLEYTITGLVKNLEDDAQALFWQFVNYDMSHPPEQVRLRIHTDFPIEEYNARIWAFGFPGTIHFVDGAVVAETISSLRSSNYVTALVTFDGGTFQTSAQDPRTFEEVRDQAFVGSDYDTNEDGEVYDAGRPSRGSSAGFSPVNMVAVSFFPFFVGIIGFIIALIVGGNMDTVSRRSYKNKLKGQYEREIPFDAPLETDFYALNRMGITGVQEMITAWLLKWILEGRVEQITTEEGWIFKKDTTSLRMPPLETTGVPEGKFEGELYRFMRQAAGNDEILSSKEFTRWAQKNVSTMRSWEKRMYLQSRENAEAKGYYAFDNPEKKKRKPKITSEGENFEDRVHKFHNYLKDFSLLSEREAAQVHIWDQLLIAAGLMGIADEVEEEFKKSYPNYEVESTYSPGTIIWANTYASTAYSSYHSSSSGSSGGGGFSSGGGGGGSFGGGGGGGTR